MGSPALLSLVVNGCSEIGESFATASDRIVVATAVFGGIGRSLVSDSGICAKAYEESPGESVNAGSFNRFSNCRYPMSLGRDVACPFPRWGRSVRGARLPAGRERCSFCRVWRVQRAAR